MEWIKTKLKMKKIFKLLPDTKREGDFDYDAELIPFENSNKVSYFFLDPIMYDKNLLPKKIYFEANFNYIPDYDFPFTDTGIFIVSKNVRNIIYDITRLEFFEVPVIMLDDTYMEEKFDEKGELNSNVPSNNDYVALRFPELKSFFDFENSVYSIPRSNLRGVTRVKKLILKEPVTGFPEIFRTKEKSSIVFIDETLKEAFELNNIKGCSFEEIIVNPYK